MRVGCNKPFVPTANTLSGNPEAMLAGFLGTSSRGFASCSPICLTKNNGPLGGSFKNLNIRAVSTAPAIAAFTTPPLTNPSSNFNPVLAVFISFLI